MLQGFKDTSGKCKNFIHEMGSLVVTFFTQAEEMEKGLAKCDAMAFREAMSASKGHVCGLIEQVAEAEGIFDAGEANFDSVLASVTKEVKAYVRLKGDEQRKEYKKECLDWIRWDHGQLDGMCFIPMIVGNLTADQALTMSQRVAHCHVPLKIMTAPLRTQAGAIKVYMKFVEFLARRVIALQERLGPGLSMVPLESESGGRSASPRHELSHSASPTRKSPPPSRHGSPIRTDSGKKASKDIFSLHSQSSLKLWATMNLSDEDVDDTFSDGEGQDNCQTPLPCPGKHPHDGSDDKASPSKRTKLDVSNLYGAANDIPSKGDVGKGDGVSDDPEKSKAKKTKKTKKTKKKSKESEEKIGKKEKAKEKDKKESIGEKKTSKDKTPKTKVPEQKTPEKTRRDPSGGENSDVATTPKSRRKPIRTAKECRQDKWHPTHLWQSAIASTGASSFTPYQKGTTSTTILITSDS